MRPTQLALSFDVAPAPTGVVRRVVLAQRVLEYRLTWARRRSIGIVVRRGRLEARAPRHAGVAQIESFIRSKEQWITARLAESAREPPSMHWAEGEQLSVFGETVTLAASAGSTTVRLAGDRLLLPPSAVNRWRAIAIDWMRAAALDLFRERVRRYAALLGVCEPSLGLSDAQTQWGSCRRTKSDAGRVLINWRMVQLPRHLTDYVVAHELAHLREPNHSPRFWAIVAQLFPDYRSARRELTRLGRALPRI